MLLEIIWAIWATMLEAAPWLLFGFIIAGAIHSFLPLSWINRYLKTEGFASIFRASLIGAPLPLCSCSIIPVVRSLRQRGVNRGAAASFMVSTPEIGVGSFILTHGLLGPGFALIRVIASIASAITVGLLVNSIKDGTESGASGQPGKLAPGEAPELKSCCASHRSSTHNHSGEDRCADLLEEAPESLVDKAKAALIFGLYTLPKDLRVLLMTGFIIAGVIAVLLPPNFIAETVSHPLLQILLALLISLPMYICATSSTPIAAVLFYKGLGTGAVLVFLLAGAATNVSTILAAKKEFGGRGAAYYVGSIIGVSLLFGIFFQYFLPLPIPQSPLASHDHSHEHGSGLVSQASAWLLLILMIYPWLLRRPAKLRLP